MQRYINYSCQDVSIPQIFTIVFIMNCVASLHIIFIYNTHKHFCMKDRYLCDKFNCCSIFIQVFSYLKLVKSIPCMLDRKGVMVLEK